MLTDDELDAMRATVIEALPELGAIHRRTATADGAGGSTVTYTVVASAVPMRLAQVPGAAYTEREVAGRASNEKRWTITVGPDTDVRRTDRIVLNGRTFEIDSVGAPHTWTLAVVLGVDEVL